MKGKENIKVNEVELSLEGILTIELGNEKTYLVFNHTLVSGIIGILPLDKFFFCIH